MKKALLFFSIFFNFFAASAQDKQPFLTKELNKEQIKMIKATSSGGGISVTAVAASEARLEVYISGNKGTNLSKEEIQSRLDEDYTFKIDINGNRLTVIAKPKRPNMNWKKALNIDFKIFVEKNVSTNLTSSGGGISLSGITGKQNFITSGGGLDINQVSGTIKGVTSGGGIKLDQSVADDIDLSTSGGGISASNSKANKISLITSGGGIQMHSLTGVINATTSGGDIIGDLINGALTAGSSAGGIVLKEVSGSLNASTSGGGIRVSIKELGQYVKLGTSSGNIELEIPRNKGVKLELYADKIKTDRLENFTGNVEDDEVNGTLSGGGVLIKAKASSGKITLTFK